MTDTNMTEREMDLWDRVFANAAVTDGDWGDALEMANKAVRVRRKHFGEQPAPAACDDESQEIAVGLDNAKESLRIRSNIIERKDQELLAEQSRKHEFGAMLSDIRTFCLMQLKTHGLDTQQTTLQLVCELAREREMFRVSCNHKGKRLKEMEPLVDAISKLYPSGFPTNEMSRILLAAAEKFRSEGWESHDPINPSK